jgi:DNA invertase Pin-like site-specific DNA recombinase
MGSAPDAVKHPPVLQSEPEADDIVSRPKPLLPEDLAGALERLEDTEVDALLAAVITEAKRRGRLVPSPTRREPTVDARSAPRQIADAGWLTTGKLNAVRAAFKAGVRPSAIARQLGISQTDVKRALAAQRSGR